MKTEISKMQGAAEAILFASGEPVSLERLAEVLELNKSTAEKLMNNLADRFNSENTGVQMVRLEDGWQMCTRPEYAEYVRKALDMRRNMPLSQAALEVLAVVAYNQPVTKAFIEQVRGVDCSAVLGSLISKGLLEERGRLDLPGRPLIYGTTPDFLRCLGISSLDELPPVEHRGETLEEESEVVTEDAG
ncbi:MAG: Segregation and condensation protein B [Thermocaproicibacter melissae]|uniref:SMC-Scp complex subunit ScpB n=1 Tax=Thermocaproicibacter melissae TaxID=2966552 RepID=UPI0024B119E4|nr:SMC-Scp complex subunit ScpB [Thermocaproicibacter melissae]WBY64637.1 SMC-Scp complex subunit ScpB [Thermocaproicibacter melissae]